MCARGWKGRDGGWVVVVLLVIHLVFSRRRPRLRQLSARPQTGPAAPANHTACIRPCLLLGCQSPSLSDYRLERAHQHTISRLTSKPLLDTPPPPSALSPLRSTTPYSPWLPLSAPPSCAALWPRPRSAPSPPPSRLRSACKGASLSSSQSQERPSRPAPPDTFSLLFLRSLRVA